MAGRGRITGAMIIQALNENAKPIRLSRVYTKVSP